MLRYTLAVVVLAVGAAGCSNSTSTSGPTDMDKMAGMSDGQQANSAPATIVGNATTDASESKVSPEQLSKAPVPSPDSAALTDPSLPSKRGFELKDWSNEAAYVLVKADVYKTADALAQAWPGKVIKDVFGKPADAERSQSVVYQLKGHPWSVFACDARQLKSLVPTLSQDADVLVFWNSDFNGWAGVELYRGGQEVEAIHWGGLEEKLGEDADASKWQSEGRVTRSSDGITFTDSYLFRGKLRKMTEAELQKGETVVDAMFRFHDAYLPEVDQMPWFDHDTSTINSPLGQSAFAGVCLIEVANPL